MEFSRVQNLAKKFNTSSDKALILLETLNLLFIFFYSKLFHKIYKDIYTVNLGSKADKALKMFF